ncbi:MAG: NUDIX domain-containing protein [Hydrogenobaculum sp.]
MDLDKIKFIGFSNKKLNKFIDKSNYIFWDWINRLKAEYKLQYIKIYGKDAVYFGKEFGRAQVFVKFENLYRGIITLRKKAVAVGVFAFSDDIYQLNVKQFRYPILDEAEEIVAGLIDAIKYNDLEKSIEETIKKEVVEELGIEPTWHIYKSLMKSKAIFIKSLYPTIGDSSEEVFLYVLFLKTKKEELEHLCKKEAGNKEENEYTKVLCIKGIENILKRDYIDAKSFIVQLWLKTKYLEFKQSSFSNFEDFIENLYKQN